jgi:hypothetical protein
MEILLGMSDMLHKKTGKSKGESRQLQQSILFILCKKRGNSKSQLHYPRLADKELDYECKKKGKEGPETFPTGP